MARSPDLGYGSPDSYDPAQRIYQRPGQAIQPMADGHFIKANGHFIKANGHFMKLKGSATLELGQGLGPRF